MNQKSYDEINRKDNLTPKDHLALNKLKKYLSRIDIREELELTKELLHLEEDPAELKKLNEDYNQIMVEVYEKCSRANSRYGHSADILYCVKFYTTIRNISMARILKGSMDELHESKYSNRELLIKLVKKKFEGLESIYDSKDDLDKHFKKL